MSTNGIENVVVKLGLQRPGESNAVFLFFSYSRLHIGDQERAVRKLKRRAIAILRGEHTNLEAVLSRYTVSLSYTDKDGDKVLILTDHDIREALQEYVDEKRVKILAEVTEVKDLDPNTNTPVTPLKAVTTTSPELSTSTHSTSTGTQVSTASKAASTQTGENNNNKKDAVVVPNVVDSLADLLICAADSVQAGVQAAAGASKIAKKEVKKAVREVKRELKMAQKEAIKQSKEATKEISKVLSTKDVGVVVVDSKPKANETNLHFPFIHGRHTCDQCLTTPIIGKRFHATNQPNFDLCEKCHKSYKGNAILFQEFKLCRDLSCQEQWRRKFAVRPIADGVEPTAAPEPERPEEETKPVPEKTCSDPGPEDSEQKPFIHGRHTCDHCMQTPIIGKRFHATNVSNFDLCENCYGEITKNGSEIIFEEAQLDRDIPFQERWHRKQSRLESMKQELCGRGWNPPGHRPCDRRSFRGCLYRGPPPPPCVPPSFASFGPPPSFASFGPPPPPLPPHFLGPPPPCPPPHPCWGPLPPPSVYDPYPPAQCSMPKDFALEEAIRRSLEDTVGNSADSKESATKEPDCDVSTPNTSEKQCVDHEEEETFIDCKAEPEELDDSKKEVVTVETVEEDEVETSKDSAVPLKSEESFASEAEGSGDIATFVGETLDRMGEAIEKLSAEIDRSMENDDGVVVADIDDDQEDDEESHESDRLCADFERALEDADDNVGMKIVDGDEDGSQGSWSFAESEENSGLGQAAQALGSALFSSDMARSNGNLSTLTHSVDHSSNHSRSSSVAVSTVASVPTTVRSLTAETPVPQVQLERWAVQLFQLHELGFWNDALNVDILETLNAANIGVDSEEEVTVQQVVERLMESKWS